MNYIYLFCLRLYLQKNIAQFREYVNIPVLLLAHSYFADLKSNILRVDDITEKETIDFKYTMYGYTLIDFLISSNCCVLNGRKGVCSKNVYTSISNKGMAVVDYCFVSYEALP